MVKLRQKKHWWLLKWIISLVMICPVPQSGFNFVSKTKIQRILFFSWEEADAWTIYNRCKVNVEVSMQVCQWSLPIGNPSWFKKKFKKELLTFVSVYVFLIMFLNFPQSFSLNPNSRNVRYREYHKTVTALTRTRSGGVKSLFSKLLSAVSPNSLKRQYGSDITLEINSVSLGKLKPEEYKKIRNHLHKS